MSQQKSQFIEKHFTIGNMLEFTYKLNTQLLPQFKCLNQQRSNHQWLKSLAFIVLTGIIPALIIGCIQFVKSNHNDFLFFRKKTKSHQLAQACIQFLTKNEDQVQSKELRIAK